MSDLRESAWLSTNTGRNQKGLLGEHTMPTQTSEHWQDSSENSSNNDSV